MAAAVRTGTTCVSVKRRAALSLADQRDTDHDAVVRHERVPTEGFVAMADARSQREGSIGSGARGAAPRLDPYARTRRAQPPRARDFFPSFARRGSHRDIRGSLDIGDPRATLTSR